MDVYGQVAAGKAQAAQYRSEADLADRQVQDLDLASVQASGQRRENLRSSLAAIEARRAASGLSLDSPTAFAIQDEVRNQSRRSEQIEKVSFNNQKYATRLGAGAKRTAASNAITLGYIGGFNQAVSNAGKAAAAA